MRTAFITAVFLFLAGCATTSTAPSQSYRAAGQKEQLSISATMQREPTWGGFSHDVTIFINGQAVTHGNIVNGSAEFNGQYDGKPILADCTAVAAGDMMYQLTLGYDRTDIKCVVFVAGERAASLLMVPK